NRFCSPCLFLTTGAIHRGAVVHTDLFESLPALRTGFASPSIDQKLLFEVARFSIAADKVPQGGSPLVNRTPQHELNIPHQVLAIFTGQGAGFTGRLDPRHKQRFICINIAHAHHDPAVHDELLDRLSTLAGALVEIFSGELITQRFRAQMGQKGVGQSVSLKPQQAAKASRITVPQDDLAKHQIEMIMQTWRLARADDAQTARHAQMNQRVAVGKLQQQVFPPTAGSKKFPSYQQRMEVRGDRPAQTGLANHDLSDLTAEDMRSDATQCGFDFG